MATANDLIKKAQSQIGVKEIPAGSNKVVYNTVYYGRAVSGAAYPWCCAFIWWLFKVCGATNLFCGGTKTAYCPTVENYYKKIGQWYTSNPKVGDLVLFDFTGKGIAGHIGILEKINADGTYTTIEGNTSVTSNDNGGAVMRRIRKKAVIRGFARPKYTNTVTPNKTATSNKIEAAASFNRSLAGMYRVTASTLNLRAGAGTNKAIITTIPNGRIVQNYGYYTTVNGIKWLYVTYGGYTGFCSSQYLKK